MDEGAGLGRVTAGAAVASAPTMAGDVTREPAMEAVLSREGEWSHLDSMEVQYGVSCRDDGGDDCRVSGDFD